MTEAEEIVDHLLENEPYGPPAPDKWTNALGSARNLRTLHRQAGETLKQIDQAIQMERQRKLHGWEKGDVVQYIRASDKFKGYSSFGATKRGSLPPDAIVGVKLKDGREITFDLAVFPERE